MSHQDPNLARLIDEITDAVLSRLEHADASDAHCHVCNASCGHQCAGVMQQAITAGACRFGISAAMPASAREIARYIDHTLLKPEATRQDILKLCQEAGAFGFASVCVNPAWVREAAIQLAGCRTVVCTVAGFPLGATTTDTKVFETRRAIYDGAREIDMVINIGALKSGDHDLVENDIRQVVRTCHEYTAICKVIIETALLTDEEKVTACLLAKSAGADFVKTSTGFSKSGASVEDVSLMRQVVGPAIGVKAAGGVRDYVAAQKMIQAGATRIGASVGVQIAKEAAGPPA